MKRDDAQERKRARLRSFFGAVPGVEGEALPPRAPHEDRASPRAYAWATLPIALATAIGLVAHDVLALADITVLYMIAVMLAALLGRGPSILAASLAVALFDFCFVPPR